MKSYTFLALFISLSIYTMAMPLAWAPPICSDVFDINNPECITLPSVPSSPEPSSMILMGIGIGGAALMRRFKKK